MPPLFHKVPMLRGVQPVEADQSARRLRLGTPAHVVLMRQGVGLLRAGASHLRVLARDAAADLRGPAPFGLPQQTTAFALGVMAFGVSVFAGTVYMWRGDGAGYRSPVTRASYEARAVPATQVVTRAAPDIRTATAVAPAPEPVATRAHVPPSAPTAGPEAMAPATLAVATGGSEHAGLPGRPAAEARVVKAVDREAPPRAGSRHRISGALLVRSEPKGAQVSINGVVHGRTPLVIRGLDAGSRVVRLDLPGYERWSWAVGVVANRQTPVTVKLQPEHDAGTD